MHLPQGSTTVPVKPAKDGAAAIGYFTKGNPMTSTPATRVTADWLNAVTDEIANVVLDAGIALDKANDAQLLAALKALGFAALKTHATDTGSVSTTNLRVVIASATSRASGAKSATMAAAGSHASGTESAVVASTGATASGTDSLIGAASTSTVSGSRSAALAVFNVDVAGIECALLAARNADILKPGANENNQCVILGSDTCAIDSTGGANVSVVVIACLSTTLAHGGGPMAAIASDNADLGGLQGAVIASEDSEAGTDNGAHKDNAAIACSDAIVSGNECAALACADQMEVYGDQVAAVGCGQMQVQGEAVAAVGSYGGGVDGNCAAAVAAFGGSVSGDQSAMIASYGCVVEVNKSATLAADNVAIDGVGQELCAGIASEDIDFNGTPVRAGVMASDGCVQRGSNSLVLASKNIENASSYCVAGGYDAGALTPSGANQRQTWRIESQTGDIYSDGVVGAGAADVAEYFENGTGKALPPCRMVTLRKGRVHLAEKGDRVLGIISPSPAFVANGQGLAWAGRFKRDRFGRIERKTVEIVRWREIKGVEAYDGPLDLAPRRPAGVEAHYYHVDGAPVVRWHAREGRSGYDGPVNELPAGTVIPGDATRYAEGGRQRVRWHGVKARAGYNGPLANHEGAIPAGAVFTVVNGAPHVFWGPKDGREAFDGWLDEAPTPPPFALHYVGGGREMVRWAAYATRSAYDGPLDAAPRPIPEDAREHLPAIKMVRWDARPARAAYNGPAELAPTPIPSDAVRESLTVPVESPEFDPAREYVPRSKRPDDWSLVGLLGQIRLEVVGDVAEDDFLTPAADGKAQRTDKETRFQVIRVLDTETVLALVLPGAH